MAVMTRYPARTGPREDSIRAREQAAQSGQRGASLGSARRKPFDAAYIPDGVHPGYWHLALLFRDLALKNDVSLRAGVPVIYEEIRRIFDWFDLEGGTRAFQSRGDGTVELTFAQVYRDAAGKQVTAAAVGEAVIREFWTRQWDASALDYFCDTGTLTEVARYVCDRWRARRVRAALPPPPPPAPVRWDRAGHRVKGTRRGR